MIASYLGHVLAHPSHEEQAWDFVANQLRHDMAASKTLPLNGFKSVAIINVVLIPLWTYRGLSLSMSGKGYAPWRADSRSGQSKASRDCDVH